MFIMFQRVILSIICIICIAKGVKENFVLNPFFCFLITPISLMIYSSSASSRFLVDLSPEVYVIGVCSCIAFIAGIDVYVSRMSPNRSSVSQSTLSALYQENYYARIGLFFAVFCSFITLATLVLGIALPFKAIVSQLFFLSIAFLMKSKQRFSYFVVIIMVLVMLLSKFRKTTFLYLFILILLPILNQKNESNKIIILGTISLLAGALFMIFIAYPLKIYFSEHGSFQDLSFDFYSLTNIMNENSENYGEIGSVFMLRPYLSMTTEWSNLDYAINREPIHTYGMWFLKPIFNILQIDTSSMPIYTLEPRYGHYNTFGFLTIQIKDFGYAGAVIFTYFLGLLTGWSYKQFREHKDNVIEIVRYLFISCAVIEMFFSNHFLLGGVHIIYLITWLFLLYLRKHNRKMYDVMTN